MNILVLAEHNNKELKSSTLSAITAASQIDENIEVLVIGYECGEVCKKIANVKFVKKVIPLTSCSTPLLSNNSLLWTDKEVITFEFNPIFAKVAIIYPE